MTARKTPAKAAPLEHGTLITATPVEGRPLAAPAPTARPAEATTLAGGLATLVAWRLGAPAEYVVPIALGLSAVPALVTGIVNQGGLVGLAKAVLLGADTYGKG